MVTYSTEELTKNVHRRCRIKSRKELRCIKDLPKYVLEDPIKPFLKGTTFGYILGLAQLQDGYIIQMDTGDVRILPPNCVEIVRRDAEHKDIRLIRKRVGGCNET